MAEKDKSFLDILNRAGMSTISIPYNIASDFLNTIPGLNTPYIDADADGFMQGGFSKKEDLDSTKRAMNNIAKATGGITDLPTSEEVYDDQILREVKKPKPKKTNKKPEQEPDALNSTKMLEKELKEKTKEGDDEKSMLQKLFERYDLVSLGADIASGKGLVEGIRDQESSIKAEKTAADAAAVEAAKTEADITYKMALAQQALKEKNPEFIRTLQSMGIDPTSPEALALYQEKISSSKGTPDLLELMLLAQQGLISQEDLKQYIGTSMGNANESTAQAVRSLTD